MTDRSERPERNEALRHSWFAAAYDILATQGYGALKLAPLCKKLGVTTGSFYHSFDNWQDFTDALLTHWLAERTEQIIVIARQTEDPVARLRLLARAAGEFLHRTEGSIRVWAGIDEHVASFQHKVDEERHHTVVEAMSAIVGPERADAYATWALSTLAGYEMLPEHQDREHLLWALETILAEAEREAKRQKRRAAASRS